MLTERAPFAYRDDPAVPAFADGSPVVIMDGDCALCTRGARIIARLDRSEVIKIGTAQSPLGRALSIHFGLDPDDPDTWLYLESGQAFGALDAMIRIGRRIGGVGHLLAPFSLLPRPARDWIYRRIARNRYALFGRTDMCAVADTRLRARLLS